MQALVVQVRAIRMKVKLPYHGAPEPACTQWPAVSMVLLAGDHCLCRCNPAPELYI